MQATLLNQTVEIRATLINDIICTIFKRRKDLRASLYQVNT